MKIIPTILTSSPNELKRKIDFLRGRVDWVQVDVVDGQFAPQKTLSLKELTPYQEEDFFWEIHLMVNNPFSWVERCNSVLAQRVVAQIELMGDQNDFIDRVEGEGMEAGLALNLKTSLRELNHEAAFRASLIVLLAVEAGFSGQKFSPQVLKKLEELLELKEKLRANFLVGIDGGITLSVLPLLKRKRVDIAYIGSCLWRAKNWEKRLRELEKEGEEEG